MPLVIAEAGVNHNGDVRRAYDMVTAAAAAGADIVKFQAFSADTLVAQGTSTAAYQVANTGQGDQIALLKSLELRADDFLALARACADWGIEFLCSIFDLTLLELFVGAGMRRIKIPSGELTNDPMLRRTGALGLPIILSTGMGTLDEVRHAVSVLGQAGASDITVLHCTSLYPAPDDVLNLRAMVSMGDDLGLSFGYSDHSLGDHIAIAVTALGATVIEKHFTLDRELPGPDHKASLEPDELAAMIRKVKAVSRALGDGVKRPASAEVDTALLVRRSWHAARDIAAGTILVADDLVLKRPANGVQPSSDLIGHRLLQARRRDEAIRLADLG
jgi:sialic acid synthase SpsE